MNFSYMYSKRPPQSQIGFGAEQNHKQWQYQPLEFDNIKNEHEVGNRVSFSKFLQSLTGKLIGRLQQIGRSALGFLQDSAETIEFYHQISTNTDYTYSFLQSGNYEGSDYKFEVNTFNLPDQTIEKTDEWQRLCNEIDNMEYRCIDPIIPAEETPIINKAIKEGNMSEDKSNEKEFLPLGEIEKAIEHLVRGPHVLINHVEPDGNDLLSIETDLKTHQPHFDNFGSN